MGTASAPANHNDLFGGLTSAVIALPLGLAFGVAAFAPLGPQYASLGAMAGLISVIFCGFFAAWLGGTPVQITGPTGPMTVVATAVIANAVTIHGPDLSIVSLILAMAVLVGGLTQILLGLIGSGRVVKYIPYPVVAGFMNGIAVIIFIGQFKPFFGVHGDWASIDLNHAWIPMSIGLITVGALLASQQLAPRLPASLMGLIAGILAYLLYGTLGIAPFSLEDNFLLIGPIPNPFSSWEQLPALNLLALERLGLAELRDIAIGGLTLGVLGAIDSLLTSVVADSITHTRHDSRRELIGQGIGNALSGLFGGLAGAGATVRTLVNVRAGGHSRRSGMIHALVILFIVVALGDLAAWIPLSALAGILFVTAVTMVDDYSLSLVKRGLVRKEFAVMLLVMGVTVSVDLMVAVGLGWIIATLLFVTQQIKKSVIRRRLRGHEVFSRHNRSYEEQQILITQGTGTLAYELEGSLFFGTTDAFMAEVEKDIHNTDRFIFDFSHVDDLDLSGVQILIAILGRLRPAGKTICFSGLGHVERATPFSVNSMLNELGVLEEVGANHIFISLDRALEYCEEQVLHQNLPGYGAQARPFSLDECEGLAQLSPTERHGLSELLTERQLTRGEYLFRQGEVVNQLVIVANGRLSLIKESQNGETRISTLSRGAIAGLRALMHENRHISSAIRAEADSNVLLLTRESLENIAERNPGMLLRLHEALLRIAMEHADLLAKEMVLLEER
jgi:SulP family sulfate permease